MSCTNTSQLMTAPPCGARPCHIGRVTRRPDVDTNGGFSSSRDSVPITQGRLSSLHMKTIARDATWLLLALQGSGTRRDPSLVDVISSADAVNHDVMSYDDFARGVGLLLAANLVHPPEGLRLTQGGRALLKSSGRGSWHERWQVIEERLEQLTVDAEARTSVTAEAFDDAVRQYLSRQE